MGRKPTAMKHGILWVVYLSTFLTATFTQQSAAEGFLPEFEKQHGKFVSGISGEERSYTIYLPQSYKPDHVLAETGHRQFPVVYIVAGKPYIDLTAAIFGNLALMGEIPDMILVSIESNFSITSNRIMDTTPTAANTDSQADPSKDRYGGGADKYLGYIAEELIPHIDAKYRTNEQRTLVGHSVGGLTVLYQFINQPNPFTHYLSLDASAWWDDQVIVRLLEDSLSSSADLKGRLFMAVSEKETTEYHDDTGMLLGNLRFAEVLNLDRSEAVNSKLQIFEGTNHGSVVLPGLYEGAKYLWGGYLPANSQILYGGMDRLTAHFDAYSEKAGGTYEPDERIVGAISDKAGELALRESDAEQKAYYEELQLDLLKLNLQTYKKSSRARIQMADHYARAGDTRSATRYYNDALRLDPENETAQAGLDKLTSKNETIELTPDEMAILVGTYRGEGIADTEILIVDEKPVMRIDGISIDIDLQPKNKTEFTIRQNQGGGTVEAVQKDGKTETLILRFGNGTFTLTPVE